MDTIGFIGGERPNIGGEDEIDSDLSEPRLLVPNRIGDRDAFGKDGDVGMTLCCPIIGFVAFVNLSRILTRVLRDVKLPIELLRRITGRSHDRKMAEAILPPG